MWDCPICSVLYLNLFCFLKILLYYLRDDALKIIVWKFCILAFYRIYQIRNLLLSILCFNVDNTIAYVKTFLTFMTGNEVWFRNIYSKGA